ncbi:MAG: hypothetical protein PHX41_15495 [Kiritimatiellae bacterium]|nr:hypothetical protein [Kiritimatiellia bacterium]
MKARLLFCVVAGVTACASVVKAVDPVAGEPVVEALTTKGVYDGFLYGDRAFDGAETPALRGTLTVKVTDVERGKLTVHAVLPDGPLNFNGKAWTEQDTNGAKRVVLSGKGRNKALLTLSVDESRIWGSLEGGTLEEPLLIDGARNVYAGTASSNAPQAIAAIEAIKGYYTVALPVAGARSTGQADAAPQGIGYLTLTVGSRGSAKIAGKLADGTSVSLSSKVICFAQHAAVQEAVAEGAAASNGTYAVCVPVFKSLRKKGWFGGLLWLRAGEATLVQTDRDLGWYLRWEYAGRKSNGKSKNVKNGADGFEMMLDACGGYYSSLDAIASHYLFSAGAPVGVTYTSGASTGEFVADAIPVALDVTAASGGLSIPAGVRPTLVDGAYDYSGTNAALAKISGSARTGLFKGAFNVYFDYTRKGKAAHYQSRVQYAGVLVPVRAEAFAELSVGMGAYLIRDNTPAFRSYNLKRSFPVVLETPVAPTE